MATARGDRRRGVGAGHRGRPARRLAHRAGGAAAGRRAPAARSSSSPPSTPSSTACCNSPYAVAKAGVEALGRSLRAELAPLGASATVAYFGWVDTKMVQDAFDRPDGERMQENCCPTFLLQADHARPRPAPPSSAGSRSARRGSSRRSGGATSPPCAASSTRCSTAAWSSDAEDRPRRSARSRPKPTSRAPAGGYLRPASRSAARAGGSTDS